MSNSESETEKPPAKAVKENACTSASSHGCRSKIKPRKEKEKKKKERKENSANRKKGNMQSSPVKSACEFQSNSVTTIADNQTIESAGNNINVASKNIFRSKDRIDNENEKPKGLELSEKPGPYQRPHNDMLHQEEKSSNKFISTIPTDKMQASAIDHRASKDLKNCNQDKQHQSDLKVSRQDQPHRLESAEVDFVDKTAVATERLSGRKVLTEAVKLYQCLFSVAVPVLQERLGRALLQNNHNIGTFLKENIHYFYHLKQKVHNEGDLCCRCHGKCELLDKINRNHKHLLLSNKTYKSIYPNASSRCKNNGRYCICLPEPRKDISVVEFNDVLVLEFFLTELTLKAPMTSNQSSSLANIVQIRHKLSHGKHISDSCWIEMELSIKTLYIGHLNIDLMINNARQLTELSPEEWTSLRKQINRIEENQEVNNRQITDYIDQSERDMNERMTKYSEESKRDRQMIAENKENITLVAEDVEDLKLILGKVIANIEKSRGFNPVNPDRGSNMQMKFNDLPESAEHEIMEADLQLPKINDQITNIQRGCLLLDVRLKTDAFDSPTKLLHSIESIVRTVLDLGKIDTSIERTIKIKLMFDDSLIQYQKETIRRFFSIYATTVDASIGQHSVVIEGSAMKDGDQKETVTKLSSMPTMFQGAAILETPIYQDSRTEQPSRENSDEKEQSIQEIKEENRKLYEENQNLKKENERLMRGKAQMTAEGEEIFHEKYETSPPLQVSYRNDAVILGFNGVENEVEIVRRLLEHRLKIQNLKVEYFQRQSSTSSRFSLSKDECIKLCEFVKQLSHDYRLVVICGGFPEITEMRRLQNELGSEYKHRVIMTTGDFAPWFEFHRHLLNSPLLFSTESRPYFMDDDDYATYNFLNCVELLIEHSKLKFSQEKTKIATN